MSEELIVKEEARNPNSAKSIYEWVESISYAFIAIFIIFAFVFRVVGVEGDSMYPTLRNGDWLIIRDSDYKPSKGDIVVINQPNERHKTLIKRVIGLEGDEIYIDYVKHELYINGALADEPYIVSPMVSMDSYYSAKVPAGHVFVMGDNRNNSLDSRSDEIGFIDSRYVLGKTSFRLLPFGQWKVE